MTKSIPNFTFRSLIAGLALFLTLGLGNQGAAQCVPNVNACEIVNPELPACIEPDTGKTGIVNTPYSETVQLLMGRTITSGATNVYLSRLEILELTNIPAGLEVKLYSGNPADPANGKASGNVTPKDKNTPVHLCAQFTGTPTQTNTQLDSISIVANVYVKIMLGGQIVGDEIDPNTLKPGTNPVKFNYRIGVSDKVGLEDQIKQRLLSLQVAPNPAGDYLQINFTLPIGADAQIQVLDAMGKVVHTENYNALEAGKHILPLSVGHLASGVYSIQLNSLGLSMTEKFVK